MGKLDGSRATKEWYVKNLQFEYYWKQEEKYPKWIDRPRRLLWNHFATRGPVCDAEEEDKLGDGDMFWNVEELKKKDENLYGTKPVTPKGTYFPSS